MNFEKIKMQKFIKLWDSQVSEYVKCDKLNDKDTKIENAENFFQILIFFLGGVTNETTFACDPNGLS